ncbi:MAG: nucleotidyltransferase family protein [Deltaproteobacteria bacterium]|nr:nucleotidyltransferase family protein [Deltaproteobacteria bacterium]
MQPWTIERLRARRAAIVSIAARRGASNLRVVGSVARGEARESSDIDLVVDFEPGRSLFDHGGLIADLEEFLGCKVDVLSARGLRERIRARLMKEAVAL